jgi:hypothetical protein
MLYRFHFAPHFGVFVSIFSHIFVGQDNCVPADIAGSHEVYAANQDRSEDCMTGSGKAFTIILRKLENKRNSGTSVLGFMLKVLRGKRGH